MEKIINASVDLTQADDLAKNIDSIVKLEAYAVIETKDVYDSAVSYLYDLKKTMNNWEKLRKSFTLPLDTAKKNVQSFFKPGMDKMKEEEIRVKKSMVSFVTEQERIAEEATKKKEENLRKEKEDLAKAYEDFGDEEAAKETKKEAENIHIVAEKADIDTQGASYREIWYAEITDFSLLPDKFKIADEKKLREYAITYKSHADLPGVVVKSKKTMIIR